MSIQAAQRMGATCISLDAGSDTPASQIAPAVQGPLHDPNALAEIIRRSRKVTLENEFIPAAALREAFLLADRNPEDLLPGIETLATIQDKLRQREALSQARIPSPEALPLEDAKLVQESLGFPMVLKARFGGYDGKGTRIVRSEAEFLAQQELWLDDKGWLAERFVPFQREVAVMVLRTPQRTVRMQTVETVQPEQVCDHTFPAHWRGGEPQLGSIPEDAVAAVHGYGLFGVELFELADGQILVNELAPRPHNTGHYSLDWDQVSQFELHVRAVLGLEIPTPKQGNEVIMLNLLGRSESLDLDAARRRALAANPSARVHWYGKAARPGRKLGHVNVVGTGLGELEAALKVREAFFQE